MQTSHCKAARRQQDLAYDWLCQDQIFIPSFRNSTGFSFSWLLALLGITRNSQVANQFPLKARFSSSWSWFQSCATRGDGTSLHIVCGDEVCACEGTQNWGRAGLGGDISAAVTHQHYPSTAPSTHKMQPWPKLRSRPSERHLGGWQKWGMLRLEQGEGGKEFVLFQSR